MSSCLGKRITKNQDDHVAARNFYRRYIDVFCQTPLKQALAKSQAQLEAARKFTELLETPSVRLLKEVSGDKSFQITREYDDDEFLRLFAKLAEQKFLTSEKITSDLRNTPHISNQNRYLKQGKLRKRLLSDAKFHWNYSHSGAGCLNHRVADVFRKHGTEHLASYQQFCETFLSQLNEAIKELGESLRQKPSVKLERCVVFLLKTQLLISSVGALPPTRWTQLADDLCNNAGLSIPIIPRKVGDSTAPHMGFLDTFEDNPSRLPKQLTESLELVAKIQSACDNFLNKKSFLNDVLPVDRSIEPELEEQFEEVPRFIRRPDVSSLLLEKNTTLKQSRLYRQRLPEGFTAVVGLLSILEMMLRQYSFCTNQTPNREVQTILTQLIEKEYLSTSLQQKLEALFVRDQLCLRDAYMHGCFLGSSMTHLENHIRFVIDTISQFWQQFRKTLNSRAWWVNDWRENSFALSSVLIQIFGKRCLR